MKINGQVTDEEMVEMIANKWLINTLRDIAEDSDYSNEEKYIIIEGFLKHWQKENPPTF